MANSLSHLLKKTRTIETVKRSKERRRKENDGSGKKEKKEGLHHRFERAEVRDGKKAQTATHTASREHPPSAGEILVFFLLLPSPSRGKSPLLPLPSRFRLRRTFSALRGTGHRLPLPPQIKNCGWREAVGYREKRRGKKIQRQVPNFKKHSTACRQGKNFTQSRQLLPSPFKQRREGKLPPPSSSALISIRITRLPLPGWSPFPQRGV